MKKRNSIPKFLGSLAFETPPEYGEVMMTFDSREMTVTMEATNGEEVTVLKPEQALMLARSIFEYYGNKQKIKVVAEEGNIIVVDFRKGNV